jgi:hypothetical protein
VQVLFGVLFCVGTSSYSSHSSSGTSSGKDSKRGTTLWQLQSLTTYICCTHLNEDRLINAYYSAKDFSGMQAQSLHCTKWEASNTSGWGLSKLQSDNGQKFNP